MASNDIELFQSFCRRYVNKAVRNHFSDVSGNDDNSLSLNVPRETIKRICLHKDSDPIVLSVGRLLIWWVEAKGLFNDVIYGIPSTDFDASNTYYPQVKLYFFESRYESSRNNRKPIRSEVSFRWRETDFSRANITELATKIHNDFAKPVFSFERGREFWTYSDKSKGYFFQCKVTNEAEAKKVIKQAINVQDNVEPDWEQYLRLHEDKQNYSIQKTVRVMGETYKKPKKRPIGTVRYNYAELYIHGIKKPIILSDATSLKPQALKYA